MAPGAPMFRVVIPTFRVNRRPAAAAAAAAAAAQGASAPAATPGSILAISQLCTYLRIAYALLSTAAVVVACTAAEHVYRARTAFAADESLGSLLGETPHTHSLKLASTVLTLCSLAALGALHGARYRQGLRTHAVLPEQRFWETGHAWNLALEGLVMALHCPVGCYANWRVENIGDMRTTYDADSAIAMLQLVRLYPLIQLLLLWMSGFETPKSVVVARRSGIKLGEELAVRAIFSRFPISFTLIVYGFIVVMLTYCLHTAERPVCDAFSGTDFLASGFCDYPALNLDSVPNCLWLIVITSLTVGYGDIYPVTYAGRTTCVVGGLLGLCTLALLCTALSNYMYLTQEEKRASDALQRWEELGKRQAAARRLVRSYVLYFVGRMRQRRGGKAAAAGSLPSAYVLPLARELSAWRSKRRTWEALFNVAAMSGDGMKSDIQKLLHAVTQQRQELSDIKSILLAKALLEAPDVPILAGRGSALQSSPGSTKSNAP